MVLVVVKYIWIQNCTPGYDGTTRCYSKALLLLIPPFVVIVFVQNGNLLSVQLYNVIKYNRTRGTGTGTWVSRYPGYPRGIENTVVSLEIVLSSPCKNYFVCMLPNCTLYAYPGTGKLGVVSIPTLSIPTRAMLQLYVRTRGYRVGRKSYRVSVLTLWGHPGQCYNCMCVPGYRYRVGRKSYQYWHCEESLQVGTRVPSSTAKEPTVQFFKIVKVHRSRRYLATGSERTYLTIVNTASTTEWESS